MLQSYVMTYVHLCKKYIILGCLIWSCLIYGFVQCGFAGMQENGPSTTLSKIRELASKNEVLTSLIKMDYVLRFSSNQPERQKEIREAAAKSFRRAKGSTPLTHAQGTWAQDGIREYLNKEAWHEDGEKDMGSVTVIDGEVWKTASKPDYMQGSIDSIDNFEWRTIGPLRFGQRLLTANYSLREVLECSSASIHGQEVINNRSTYIVDTQFPNSSKYYARIWIDQEAGLPLQVEIYDRHPSTVNRKLVAEIRDIQLHRLPNGGWVPIKGTDAVYFSDGEIVHTRLEVEVSSITIKREDIPDSLFTIEFPDGAKVYNAFTDTLMQGGKIIDHKLETIVDRNIQDLFETNTETTESISEQSKQKTPSNDSQQVMVEGSPNNPIQSTERNTDILLDTYPTNKDGFSLFWFFFCIFLTAFALTALVLVFCRSYKNNPKGRII